MVRRVWSHRRTKFVVSMCKYIYIYISLWFFMHIPCMSGHFEILQNIFLKAVTCSVCTQLHLYNQNVCVCPSREHRNVPFKVSCWSIPPSHSGNLHFAKRHGITALRLWKIQTTTCSLPVEKIRAKNSTKSFGVVPQLILHWCPECLLGVVPRIGKWIGYQIYQWHLSWVPTI